MKCTWEYNGVTYSSLEDLETYIKANHPEYLREAGIKYSYQATIDSIKASTAAMRTKKESSIGALDMINITPNLVQGVSEEDFKKRFEEQIVKDLTESGMPENQINKAVKNAWTKKQQEIKKARELGKGTHLLIENLVRLIRDGGQQSPDVLYKRVIANTEKAIQTINAKISDGTMEPYADGITPSIEGFNHRDLTENLMWAYRKIEELRDKAAVGKFWIRTEEVLEAPLGEEYANNNTLGLEGKTDIRGKVDILIIYEDKYTGKTKAEVIDIKTSSASPIDWDWDRKATVDTQLRVYKRMLATLGIREYDIDTHKMIFKIDTSKENTPSINAANAIFDVSYMNKTDKELMIHKLIPLEEIVAPSDTEFVNNVSNDLNVLFGFDTSLNRSEAVIADSIKRRIHSVNGKFRVNYMDSDTKAQEFTDYETYDEAEDFVKEELGKGNTKLAVYVGNTANRLSDMIERARNGVEISSDELDDNAFWRKNIQKYIAVDGWRIEKNTIYNSLNIIMFVNDITKEIDIVSLTNDVLSQEVSLGVNKGTTILANFFTDDEVMTKRNDYIQSTVGNLELMKCLVIANRLNVEGYTIGEVKAFNTNNKTGTTPVIPKNMIANFKTLCSRSENKVPNNNIKFADRYQQILDYITYSSSMVNKGTIVTKLNSQVDKLNASNKVISKNEQMDNLIGLLNIIKNENEDIAKGVFSADSFPAMLYQQISMKISELSGVSIDYANSKNISNWGLQFNRGFLTGLMINTLDSIKILQSVNLLKHEVEQRIRSKYQKYKSQDNAIMKAYIDYAKKKDNTIILANPAINLETIIFKKFFNTTNNFDLVLIDPTNADQAVELDSVEKEFLTWYLADLNKHRIIASGGTITVDQLQATGMYWKLPLTRSNLGSRIIHRKGKDIWKGMKEDYNSQLQDINHEMDLEDFNSKNIQNFKMQNSMLASDSETARSRMLEGHDPYIKFDTNFESVKDLYVQGYVNQQEWDNKLPILNSVIVALRTHAFLYGQPTEDLVGFMNDYIQSSIKGSSIIEKEFNGLAKVLRVGRKTTTIASLGFNWKSGFKEFVISNYTLYKNAVVNTKFDKDRLSFSDVDFATKYVWGDLFQQYDPDKITTCQGLNFLYGMVNMTVYDMAEKQNFDTGKMFKFSNRLMFFNRLPDFTGRMTLLVGYLNKFGALDAHTIKDNYEIVYDWRKDNRFALYASDTTGKTISEEDKREWGQQKGNYVSRMMQLIDKGETIDDGKGGTRLMTVDDDLVSALTTEEIAAIKQESNTMFGYMDADVKSPYLKKVQGLIFGQFSTYLSSKKNQIFMRRDQNGQGKWVPMTDIDTGEALYRKEVYDIEGQLVDYELTTEVNDNPVYGWQGTITEGIFWSLVDLFNITKMENVRKAWNDPYKMKNLLIALEDLTAILLLLIIGTAIFGDRKRAKGAEKVAANLMLNAAQDINGVQSLGGVLKFQVPTLEFINNTSADVKRLILGDIDFGYFVGNRFSAVRDFVH